ncbi:carbamoyltransferase [Gillisia sp. Hel_I_86]|uniref:carbamoyltransferase family protein n=1 Tax=Gillisia sp. Hel_I_86 TaxID=1249981 RepID=UPI00119A706D|nr:carbamoyltransferase [Gillisia sp. Hel_I_86]TVZ28195.1 carbamoyltransferase [Gillisia sp. Hel_I_86]
MKILGISCFYHDSAASIMVNNEIIASVQEERFTRIKHTPDFPINSIKFCLEETGLLLNELDAIIFYDKPLLKFERLLSTYYAIAPQGLFSFLRSIPIWIKEKMFFRKLLKEQLKNIDKDFDSKKVKILFSEHHLSHAASSFFVSNYQESAILTIDGVGEWSTASIGIGKSNKIEILKELYFPHSLGLLYSAFTYYLGFRVNSGEYKLMGLAPYGNPESKDTKIYISKIKDEIIDIKEDGSLFINQKYFRYAGGSRMIDHKKFETLFGLKVRDDTDELLQSHCNLAFAIQDITEEVVIKMAKEAKRLTNSNNLCLSGGVALNCVANGKIHGLNLFGNIYIQPASGDAGGALGAALAANYMYFQNERIYTDSYDNMKGSYLGPYYSNKEILSMNKKYKATSVYHESFESTSEEAARLLSKGFVVGWFQGRSEFGPRALGNRSILADPRNHEMQKKLNLKIKYREGFRPFAPSVLEEDYEEFFKDNLKSPYMLMVKEISERIKCDVPENYYNLNYWDKLYTKRSSLQSITHVDFSARIQTVSKNTNKKFWTLINEFKKVTGVGVLVNTSFNVRGEPIVNSPEDAYRCFMSTEMDYLVINNHVYDKNTQIAEIKREIFKND